MTEEDEQKKVTLAQDEVHELLKQIPTLCGQVGQLVAGVSSLEAKVSTVKTDLSSEIGLLRKDNSDDHKTIFEWLRSLNQWKAKVIGVGIAIGVGVPILSAVVIGLLNGHIRLQP